MSQTILRFCTGGHLVKKGDGDCFRVGTNTEGQETSKFKYGRNCTTERTNYQAGILGGLSYPGVNNGFNVILYPEQNPAGNEYVLQDTGIYNDKYWRAYYAGDFGWKAVSITSLQDYLPELDLDGKLPIDQNDQETQDRGQRASSDLPLELVAAGAVGFITLVMLIR